MATGAANHFERGRLLFERERWRQAADAFAEHLDAWPDDHAAHAMRAVSLAKSGDGEAARAASDASMRIDPNVAYNSYARGIVALHVELPAEDAPSAKRRARPNDRQRLLASRTFAQRAVDLDPHFMPAFRLLARIAWQLNEAPTMRGAAEQALRLSPADGDSLGLLARSFEIAGQPGAALAAAESGLSLVPDHAMLQAVRAWALLQRGNDHAAERGFAEALRLNPTDANTQLGFREARHNVRLRSRSRWRRFWLSEKERRPTSNRVSAKTKATSSLGVMIAVVAYLASTASRTTVVTSTPPPSLPESIGLVATLAIIVGTVVLVVWWQRRRDRRPPR